MLTSDGLAKVLGIEVDMQSSILLGHHHHEADPRCWFLYRSDDVLLGQIVQGFLQAILEVGQEYILGSAA